MKKNIIGKIITVVAIISVTVEMGVFLGCYMLLNIDFNKYNTKYEVMVVR